MVDASIQKRVSVVELGIQTDNELDILLFEIVEAIQEGCGELTLQGEI